MKEGQILLAGDSVHQVPPYAGQGANSGISDAHNLSWKLALVLNKQANPELLETYEEERLPVCKAAAEVSGSAADDRGLLAWKLDFRTASSLVRRLYIVPGFGYRHISKAVLPESTWPLGGASWRCWSLPNLFLALDGRPGSRVPHLWLEKQGNRISTVDLCKKGFVLLAGSDGRRWREAAGRAAEVLNGVDVKAYCVGAEGDFVDTGRKWEAAAGLSSTGMVLVRPDGFVAWRERRMVPDCEEKLKDVLRRILGR